MTYSYWFRVPLTCLNCGAVVSPDQTRLHADGLNHDIRDAWLEPGQEISAEPDDFGMAYTPLRDATSAPVLRVLDGWACPACGEAQWARLDFLRLPEGRFRLLKVCSVPLTVEELRSAHYIGKAVSLWVREEADEASRPALLAVLGRASSE